MPNNTDLYAGPTTMSGTNPSKKFKLVDLLSRTVPSAFFLFIVIVNISGLRTMLMEGEHAGVPDSSLRFWAMVLSKISIICFLGLMSVLFLIRIEPIKKTEGLLPRFTALVGTFCLYAMTFFPRVNLSIKQSLIATSISVLGTGLSVFALAHLGRSFSLMAEARRLVTTGPYRLVRHPLYLFETIASLGVLLHFLSGYTLLVFLAYILIQLQRMKNEEAILHKAFPEYEEYRARTYRVIPLVY